MSTDEEKWTLDSSDSIELNEIIESHELLLIVHISCRWKMDRDDNVRPEYGRTTVIVSIKSSQ